MATQTGKTTLDIKKNVATITAMARPMKSEVERKKNTLRIRMTEDERRLLDAAAQMLELDTSTWARGVLLRAAKRRAPTIFRGEWESSEAVRPGNRKK